MDLSGPERTHGLAGKGAGPLRLASSLRLPQHSDEHRPKRGKLS
jgi:hypothetical protein